MDFGHQEDTSLIYAVLPPLLKRSVTNVRSLRRSMSSAAALVGHVRNGSADGSRPGSATPPPPYQEPIASLTSVLSDDNFQDTPPISPSFIPIDAANLSRDTQAGIERGFARQGLSLLQGSLSSSYPSANPDFSRQLYIDAVSYLLRGLPRNLSNEETLRVQAAIPLEILPSQPSINKAGIQRRPSGDSSAKQHEEYPTIVHRAVATMVLQFFLLISFLWPYCCGAYRYERKHHISERVLAQSWMTANALSRNTLAVGRTVCRWNDGQVGNALEDVVLWLVQGVTGGLREGVKDGMQVFGMNAENFWDNAGSTLMS